MNQSAPLERLLRLGYAPAAVTRVQELAGDRFRGPEDVGRILDNFPYEHDWALDYHIRSAQSSLLRQRIMCINAAILGYALLECFPHVRRELLAIHRRGPDGVECGHVVTVYWNDQGRAGAFSKSNFAVLNHRPPIFPSVHALALSYAQAYMSMNFKPLYFGTPRLEAIADAPDWRFAPEPVDGLLQHFVGSYAYEFEIEPPRQPARLH